MKNQSSKNLDNNRKSNLINYLQKKLKKLSENPRFINLRLISKDSDKFETPENYIWDFMDSEKIKAD